MIEELNQWYDKINNHINKSSLINLRRYELPTGEKPFGKFTDITRSKKILKPFSISDFKHADEFLFLSEDLIYIIAVLELLHPNINNVFREDGTYNQTPEDHLYLRYAGFGYQVIYNYWDRIGDILSIFFYTGLKEDVYLTRVFNNFPVEYRSDTYMELFILFKTVVEPIVFDRHGVVHSFGLKSKHFWGIVVGNNDDEKKQLQKEKDSYPQIFRNQLDFFFQGFALAMKLIDELPNKVKEVIAN